MRIFSDNMRASQYYPDEYTQYIHGGWKGPINSVEGKPPVFQNESTGEISAEPPSGWKRGVIDQIALALLLHNNKQRKT